jgi:hypothetical protein
MDVEIKIHLDIKWRIGELKAGENPFVPTDVEPVQ